MARDPNEPAFPRSYTADGHNGLTKREWFAGQALIGLLAETKRHPLGVSREAYEIADAMMAEGDRK